MTAYGQVDGWEVLRCVGRQIGVLRGRAQLTQAELGETIGYSSHAVAAAEQGRRPPSPVFLDGADQALEAGGVLTAAAELVEHVRAAGSAGCPSPSVIAAWHAYAPSVVPELLCTDDYARAVLRALRPTASATELDAEVSASAAHRQVLHGDSGLLVTCVLEEAVLHRAYGGPEALRGQIAYLAEVARLPRVQLQVMPLDAVEHAAPDGPLLLLEPATDRPVVARTGHRTVTRPAEVRALQQRYGTLRGQALSPADSLALLENPRMSSAQRFHAGAGRAAGGAHP
ncbi:helix-turn-helix domain-containing protein [Streptomyces xinghaiensis]|uniref:helix-turn-helix domain-containing protein n=1 Tax=Streptomyces xinghaiensis TaxID=1038928 RepID=UPI0002DD1E45|nr:helix-turn-helix transcriptional regulator [Streptomyces xinghaiensis]MZE77221.1 helix-turn-helix domain-containing protein [Streptomyces sp. SID5475]